ncbi:MAG: CopG family transcriptional regulator [Rhizonema sp. PD37]|nr:CopG family transcriptional regulator [Rhizonema sp. PD37]
MRKKWAVRKITINLTFYEAQKFNRYCEVSGKCMSDVIRELIRTLPDMQSNKNSHKVTNH